MINVRLINLNINLWKINSKDKNKHKSWYKNINEHLFIIIIYYKWLKLDYEHRTRSSDKERIFSLCFQLNK